MTGAKDGAAPEAGPSHNYFPLVVALSFLIMLVAMLDRAIITVLMPAIKSELNLSDSAIGLLAGLPFAMCVALFGIPIGWLADKRGERVKIATLSLFIWGLACMACGTAGGFASLFMLRMLVGAGEGGGQSSVMSVLIDSSPDTWRRRAVTACAWGAIAGQVIAVTLGGWIVTHYGWRWAFVAAGAPGILLAAVYFLCVKEPAKRRAAATEAPDDDGSLLESLRVLARSRPYVLFLIGATFASAVLIALLTWLPTYFVRRYGIDMAEAGKLLGMIIMVAGGAAPPIYSWIGDRLAVRDKRWPLWICALSTLLALPFLTLSFFLTDREIATASLMAGAFFLSGLAPILPVAARDLAPAYKTAGIAGQGTVTMLGSAIVTWLIGFVSDIAGTPGSHGALQIGMLVIVPAGVIGVFFYLFAAQQLAATANQHESSVGSGASAGTR